MAWGESWEAGDVLLSMGIWRIALLSVDITMPRKPLYVDERKLMGIFGEMLNTNATIHLCNEVGSGRASN